MRLEQSRAAHITRIIKHTKAQEPSPPDIHVQGQLFAEKKKNNSPVSRTFSYKVYCIFNHKPCKTIHLTFKC